MRRTLAGIVVGIAVAIGTIMIVETIGYRVAPPPRGLDLSRPDAVALLRFETLIFPVAGWVLGSFAGSLVAALVSQRAWSVWWIAGAVLIGAVAQFTMISHPLWMMVTGIVGPPAAAWLAQRIAARRASASN